MPLPVFSVIDLIVLVTDHHTRRALQSLAGTSVQSKPYILTRGDLVKGQLYMVVASGIANPALYVLDCHCDAIAVTDGISQVYVAASALTHIAPGTGNPYPHIGFKLDVSGSPLDAALSGVVGDHLEAVIEARVTQIATLESGDSYTQNECIIREPCWVYKTALNPL